MSIDEEVRGTRLECHLQIGASSVSRAIDLTARISNRWGDFREHFSAQLTRGFGELVEGEASPGSTFVQ